METCDEEFAAAAKDFMGRAQKDGKPFFVWLNTTHMHFMTHTKKESLGQSGRWQSPYHDTMIDHDKLVGEVLAYLDEQGIADNTFVMYSTDNGPHRNSWPDGGMTRSAARRTPTGKGRSGCRCWFAGPGRLLPAASPMRSSSTTTGCRRFWRWPATPRSWKS